MSGRGLPGGGLVRHHKPEDIQVTLKLHTTISSPTVRLAQSSPEASVSAEAFIQIHASVKTSTRPSLPVTLSTWRTALERALSPKDSTSPVWLNSALTYLRSTRDDDRYGGPPALGYKIHRRGGFARNLREDWDFITIPSMESGGEVVVEHRLPVEDLQFWKRKSDGYVDSVTPEKGEVWNIGPSEGGLGTFWWAWGDLEGGLKDKEFRNDEWFDGELEDGKGNQMKGQANEKWVYPKGENGFGLCMEIENQVGVTFV
ncbi:hypothetical protein XANCAGTX0491_008767 [Xanthoria calcicola]